MSQRYSTEIRGDGTTRTWTLPHGLDDREPAVSVHDAANRDVSGSVPYAWPSMHEVAIRSRSPRRRSWECSFRSRSATRDDVQRSRAH